MFVELLIGIALLYIIWIKFGGLLLKKKVQAPLPVKNKVVGYSYPEEELFDYADSGKKQDFSAVYEGGWRNLI
jgi:hypothetical protein